MTKRKLMITKPNNYGTLEMNMKFLIIKILPLLLIFSACVAPAVFAQQQEEQSTVAVVIRVNGALEFRESAGGDWKSAKVNQPLFNGNQLRTGIGNRAIIVYTSGTRVLVNENTELEIIAQMPPGKFQKPTSERTKLLIGEVYSRIGDRKEKTPYEVETPSSVASVRGTEFNSQFADGQATYLSMLNVIEVMNQFGSVLLQQFQTTTVTTGQAPPPPSTLSKSDATNKTKWMQNVEPIWKLNIVPQGGSSQATGGAFTLTIWAENIKTGAIDTNASFRLSAFTASSDALEFSTDNGKTWAGPPEVIISNGQAVLQARGRTEGSLTITAEARDCQPASLGITIAKPKGKKTVEMRFTNPDGTGEETLIIELEEK